MKFKKSLVAVGATALIAVGGSAWAVAPYQVDVGSSTSGSFGFTADTPAGIEFVSHGAFGDIEMGCDNADATGSITAGVSSTGNGIGSIGSTAWSGCVGPLGLDMAVTQSGTWNLDITATNETAGASDVVAGRISNVTANVAAVGAASQCSFSVTGAANATFNEANQDLIVNETAGNLVLSGITPGVNDCFGLVANGDPADFIGTFDVSSSGGAINVKPSGH